MQNPSGAGTPLLARDLELAVAGELAPGSNVRTAAAVVM